MTDRRHVGIFEVRTLGDREIELSFSSEIPYDRGDGRPPEVLSHEPDSIDLDRLNKGGSVLVEHDPDRLVGRVSKAWVDTANRKCRAVVKLGSGSEASAVLRDVRDGIRSLVSVGYRIKEQIEQAGRRLVRKWEPLEISFVTIPADTSVGVGRSINTESEKMNTTTDNKRTSGILRVAEKFGIGMDRARAAIENGETVEQLLEGVAENFKLQTNAGTMKSQTLKSGSLQKDQPEEYNLLRALHGAASGRLDGYEAEVSQELARTAGRAPTGIYIPLNSLAPQRRDLTATGGTGGDEGGIMIATDKVGFIDALRPRLAIARLGATVLSGLTGDVSIPRQPAASSATWKTENAELDEVSPAFDHVLLQPKRVGAYAEISKQLLVQTDRSAERIVATDLVKAIATALDAAAIDGSGSSGEPEGIINATGISVHALGTNGANPTFSDMVELQKLLADDNADNGSLGFLTNPTLRAYLQSVIYDTGSGLNVMDKAQGLGPWAVSTQVPSNLVKGTSGAVCSAVVYGDFSQVILAQFGEAADVTIDPYTKATSGLTRVIVHSFVDVGVRQAEGFAVILDALTS